MDDALAGFDEYERRARLTPGLLAIAPVAILIVTLGFKAYPAVAAITGILVAAGGTYLLAVLVRHLGRAIEPDLWQSWGGPPTTSRLRARSDADNPVMHATWRDAIQHVTGISLLDESDEAADQAKADQLIEAAVRQVTRLGQDERYPLVLKENIQYGFERNFYGVRWVGRAVSAACVAVLVVALLVDPARIGSTELSSPAIVSGLLLDGVFLAAWCFLPSEKRIRLAGERYAAQLLQAVVVESRKHGG